MGSSLILFGEDEEERFWSGRKAQAAPPNGFFFGPPSFHFVLCIQDVKMFKVKPARRKFRTSEYKKCKAIFYSKRFVIRGL